MTQTEMLKIVDQFCRGPDGTNRKPKVMRISDSKTTYVETIGDIGRSIFFNEYKVDGQIYWAGYSARSDTVFVSQSSQR